MNKKSIYRPVNDKVVKVPKKELAQGSMISGGKLQQSLSFVSPRPSHTKSNRSDLLESNSSSQNRSKVICHSPHIVHMNISQSSKSTQKVPIDHPPSIYLTSNRSLDSTGQVDSGIHTSNIEGAPLDLSSTAKPVFVESSDLDNTPYPESDSRKAMHSINTGLSKHVPASGKENIKRKKKPTYKVVESRYKATSVKPNTTVNKSSSASKGDTSTGKTKEMAHKTIGRVSQVKHKPETRKDLLEKISTPSAGFKSFFNADVSNVEHVREAKSQLRMEHDSSLFTTKPEQKLVKPRKVEIGTTDVNLRYSAYLRLFYLRHKMQEAFESRSQQTLQELSLLVNANVNLQEELIALEEEEIVTKHQDSLEKNLETQITALAPIVNKLNTVQEKYQNLAESLDTTRHSVPLHGVVVPNVKQLEKNLLKTKEILGDTSTLLRTHVDSCSNAADKSKRLVSAVDEEHLILAETQSLCDTAVTLAVKHMSLTLGKEVAEA